MGDENTRQGCSNLQEKLNKVSIEQSIEQSDCTIYKVHRHLRDVNPKAYEPEIIAIGPYHRNTKDDLKMMEDHKLRYFNLLLQRIHKNLEYFVSNIAPLELRARMSYAEPISLTSTDFIEMLVLDGCFIIELVRKYDMCYLRQKKDPIFRMHWIIDSLRRDLILFENQIPFFVLCKLFDLIEIPDQHPRLIFLLTYFLEVMYPGKGHKVRTTVPSDDTKHLLDFIYRTWSPPSLVQSSDSSVKEAKKEKRVQFINRAARLKEANVKFESNEKENLFKVDFKNGTIFMAPLTIEDRTESLFRNLIVYEQYFQDSSPNSVRYMSDYVHLLDCLIDSSKDIEILHHNGIIENWLGDEEEVAKMVNKLGVSISGPDNRFIYTEIFDNVNDHCGKRRNRWMAKLRRTYLNSPWTIISIGVAIVLLLLSITQTVFTILQVV